MKSVEKYLTALKNPAEETAKRYKALTSLKKTCKEYEDMSIYIQALNEHHINIFFSITEKMTKMPTSTFEKVLTMTSSSQQLVEYLEYMQDLFNFLEKPSLKELLSRNKVRIIAILYKLLEVTTKKEYRRMAFHFLLRILDSFEDPIDADKEYLCLFNYALDHPALRENSSKPAYILQISNTSTSSNNDIIYHLSSFGEMSKVIVENPNVARSETAVMDIFDCFTKYLKSHKIAKSRARVWYHFFNNTWKDIFFNSQGVEKVNSVAFFIETKKKSMTFNASMLKLLVYLFETILRDKVFMLSQDDLFGIMESMKYLYWDTRLKAEVNKVLRIFYDFVAGSLEFYTEGKFEDATRVKLIATLDENCYNYFFQEFMHINLSTQDREDYEVISSQPQENLCLSIFNELIRIHENKYSKEIFKTVEFALQKASTQIGNPSKDYLYPLVETVLLIAIRAEPEQRPEFETVLKQYLEYKEIAAKVNDFMIKRTEAFICSYYNEVKYELLQHMEIVSGQKVYSMKIEYLIQYLLQEFCRENREKGSKEYSYFENQINSDRVLQVNVSPNLLADKELAEVLKSLQVKFNQWINCLVLIYNLEFSKSKNMFPYICRGISDIIQKLIEPDAIQVVPANDRVKVSPKPRYPVPTETLYQIFGHYFALSLNMQEKPKYEGRLWATKAYLKIFCNTQSEIPPTKSIIIELISFINSAVKPFTLKDDDLDLFMTICIVLKNSEQIFLTDYPGIKILIPNYLKLIESMLATERFNQLDQTSRVILDKVLLDTDPNKIEVQLPSSAFVVKNAALNVLKSILFMGYAIPDMKIINIPEGKTGKVGSPEAAPTMEIIREKAFIITYKALERLKNLKPRGTKVPASNESSDIELQFNLLTLSTIIVYLECHPTTIPKYAFGNISIVDFIDLYLQQFCFDLNAMHQEHLSLHIQAVGTLASIISSDMKHYTKIYRQIISTLTSTLASIPQKQPSPQKKELAADLFFALLKWILSDKTGVLIKEEITLHGLIRMMTTFSSQPEYRDVFEMFFNNIFVNYMNFPFKNQDRDNTRSIFDETSFKDLPTKYLECLNPSQRLEEFDGPRERFNADFSRLSVMAKSETTETQATLSKLEDAQSLDMYDNDYELDIQDSNESKQKRDRLVSLFDYLPFPKDELKKMLHAMSVRERDIIDYLNSQINGINSETQHGEVRYLTFRDTTFISAASSSSRTTGGRILFRNMTGKFAWEFSYLQALDQKALEPNPKMFDDINKKTLTVKCLNLFQENVQVKPSAVDALNLQLRETQEKEASTQRDVFKELYEYIKQHVTDFVEFNLETLAEVKRDLSLSNSDQFEIKYDKAKDLEEKIAKRYKREVETEHTRRQDIKEMNQNKKLFQLDENILKLSNFDGIRMLFSHLGYLSLFKNMELGVFENNKANSNLQTTVNLLDSAPARETIKIGVIYVARGQDNQKDILKNTSGSKSYEDFIANLGQRVSLRHHLGFQAGLKHKADGEMAIYHSDALTELMFHVATMMPTEAEDDQVLNKKKHVGNDFVNIIWCENYRGYRVNTITTQFNFVQIVIYPIKFNLFKVVIFKKSNINYLFPWLDNMIISKEHLPLLVKLCSIHGFRKSRAAKDSPFKSYQKRTDYLKQFNVSESAGNTTQFKKKTDPFDIVSSLLLN